MSGEILVEKIYFKCTKNTGSDLNKLKIGKKYEQKVEFSKM